jgi:hypothetical protein
MCLMAQERREFAAINQVATSATAVILRTLVGHSLSFQLPDRCPYSCTIIPMKPVRFGAL